MLFNSINFILLFLPITFTTYYIFARYKLLSCCKITLALASLFFYGYWDYRYLALLLFSIIFNFRFGKFLSRRQSKLLLFIGISVNLVLLGYFKYTDFFISIVNSVSGADFNLLHIILPLGISFITFQKIAFLVDSYRNTVKEYNFLNYFLFVVFFPQLIAGPIVHHSDIIPQFKDEESYRISQRNIALGLFVFSMGLFKKVVIADTLALWVSPGFDTAASLTLLEAWGAAVSYTFQLYFDFSGYSEMAIGLALLFNINLPVNFISPYKAGSIIEFWRSWHVSLSTFLRNYVYIPLGGKRKGKIRRYANLFITMFLGGLWHGAGWTYVLWGSLHGIYLILNHAFIEIKDRFFNALKLPKEEAAVDADSNGGNFKKLVSSMMCLPSRLFTLFFVVIAWVFFRARSFQDAFKVLKGIFGLEGVKFNDLSYLPGGSKELIVLVLILLWVNFAPNTLQVAEKVKPDWKWLLLTAALFCVSYTFINRVSEFIYFQF